jgi:hypothetical protein
MAPSTGQSSGISYFGGGARFGDPTAGFLVDFGAAALAPLAEARGVETESARGDAMMTISRGALEGTHCARCGSRRPAGAVS